jgi:hypothetical protein
MICDACIEEFMQPFDFSAADQRVAAKSTSCTMMPTVCQLCGHKFDGMSAGEACDCTCHRSKDE